MFRNYINIAIRSLKRQKAYSLINISGLSVGIMACIIILLYVRNESSYESFYTDADNIYRVTSIYETSGQTEHIAIAPSKITQVALEHIPETELATFVFDWSVGREFLVRYEDKTFTETNVFYADSSFFKVFQYEFLDGNASNALTEEQSIVLTESTAKKYFANVADAYGKMVNANGSDFLVTGVVEKSCWKYCFGF